MAGSSNSAIDSIDCGARTVNVRLRREDVTTATGTL